MNCPYFRTFIRYELYVAVVTAVVVVIVVVVVVVLFAMPPQRPMLLQ